MGWGRHHGTFGVLGLGSVLSLSCMSTCAHTRAHAHTYTHTPPGLTAPGARAVEAENAKNVVVPAAERSGNASLIEPFWEQPG